MAQVSLRLAACASLLAVAVIGPGRAEAADKFLSLTISPLHLVLPVGELTAEVKVADSVGVAAVVGVGSIKVEFSDGTQESFGVLEAGAQVRWYVLGDFDGGLELGAEMLYVRLNGDRDASDQVKLLGEGLAVGPFVGYKGVVFGGLTLEAQLGAQAVLAVARGSSGSSSSTAKDTLYIPLLNLNIGWTF